MSLWLHFFSELETTEGWIVQRVHLYIWATVGHKLTAIRTRAQNFDFTMHKVSNSIAFLNFKTSLVITPPTRERHYDVMHTKIDIWVTLKSTFQTKLASAIKNINQSCNLLVQYLLMNQDKNTYHTRKIIIINV